MIVYYLHPMLIQFPSPFHPFASHTIRHWLAFDRFNTHTHIHYQSENFICIRWLNFRRVTFWQPVRCSVARRILLVFPFSFSDFHSATIFDFNEWACLYGIAVCKSSDSERSFYIWIMAELAVIVKISSPRRNVTTMCIIWTHLNWSLFTEFNRFSLPIIQMNCNYKGLISSTVRVWSDWQERCGGGGGGDVLGRRRRWL